MDVVFVLQAFAYTWVWAHGDSNPGPYCVILEFIIDQLWCSFVGYRKPKNLVHECR